MKAIVTCACEGVPLSAQATWRVMSSEQMPITWSGHRISVLLSLVPQGSPIYEHILACSKNSGKFAYLFDWDADGNIKKIYNLLSRKEIK